MRVSFGPYILDLESRQLLRGDDLVHLSPKAFDSVERSRFSQTEGVL